MFKNKVEIVTLKTKDIVDFASERNRLLKRSKADWILFLDSDEVITKQLDNEINNLQLNSSEYNGYKIYRKNYFLGKYIGTDNIIRLGKRNGGMWERGVHEIWKINGKVGQLKNPIIHNSFKNLNEAIGKINNYSTIHAKANRHEGKTSNIVKIIIFPKIKFIQSLVMGRGIVFSIIQAFHSFLAWSKQYLKQDN